jgi:hypothetical protein
LYLQLCPQPKHENSFSSLLSSCWPEEKPVRIFDNLTEATTVTQSVESEN